MDHEALRKRYKPARIDLLFVGESPPAGGTFFYAGNSNLFRAMAAAFATAFGSRVPQGPAFLDFFRDAGCYLDDLCLEPVNHMEDVDRRRCRREGERALAARLEKSRPKVIVAVPMSVERHVARAIEKAGLPSTPLHGLPFPAMGHQRRFAAALVSLLRSLEREKIFHPPA